MTAITPIPTSSEAKGTSQVESTQSSTALLASSTSGINAFIPAASVIVPPAVSDWKVPGNVVGGMKNKNKYIVLANKKVYTINASSALSALKKVCSTIRLKSGKVKVQKVNPKRKTMIHKYKVQTLKNGKLEILKL
jgi:hypothetical protein